MTKITPQTYIDMNKEFEEEGTPIRIVVPTQEEIDDWQERSKGYYCEQPTHHRDLVKEMWDKIGGRPDEF